MGSNGHLPSDGLRARLLYYDKKEYIHTLRCFYQAEKGIAMMRPANHLLLYHLQPPNQVSLT